MPALDNSKLKLISSTMQKNSSVLLPMSRPRVISHNNERLGMAIYGWARPLQIARTGKLRLPNDRNNIIK